MKDETKAVMALIIMAGIISVFVFMIINITTSYEIRYTLIDGNDIISYEVIDGNTINIVTENETYEVELYGDTDFTVSSDIYIEIINGYQRSFFWEEFEPEDNIYSLNKIIKIPTLIEGDE